MANCCLFSEMLVLLFVAARYSISLIHFTECSKMCKKNLSDTVEEVRFCGR